MAVASSLSAFSVGVFCRDFRGVGRGRAMRSGKECNHAGSLPLLANSPPSVRWIGTPPTNFNRSTSRTWRMVVLSAGIRSLLWTAKGADLSRPAEAPHPGRDHPGMVGDIISERWARSSRNGWAASSRNDGRLAPESACGAACQNGRIRSGSESHCGMIGRVIA
jgi:hypothetical protein